MQAKPFPASGGGSERRHRLPQHPAVQSQREVAVGERAHELGGGQLWLPAVAQP